MSEAIEISSEKEKLDIDYICDVLKTLYWAKNRPRELIEISIRNSYCFAMFSNGRQIGFARVITDYSTFAYLADVFIDQAERGRGLGKRLVKVILEDQRLQMVGRWHLLTRDAHGLYEKFGFMTPDECFRYMEKTAWT